MLLQFRRLSELDYMDGRLELQEPVNLKEMDELQVGISKFPIIHDKGLFRSSRASGSRNGCSAG